MMITGKVQNLTKKNEFFVLSLAFLEELSHFQHLFKKYGKSKNFETFPKCLYFVFQALLPREGKRLHILDLHDEQQRFYIY